ncbi:Acetyltransferase (GNAT) domain-containing protein [Gracilibacillus ureilyticus]|uniref:Acetyltransferase (GNAT) domain-containing protein n=1 Tax=Gracilibacillus ureilyticus TaxID=531814 RepID=A0A1H9VBZ9_9BACI|nr:GNAT family N-acetyltransferase [Gracilibacillus ureilyticus]SES18757.1 Acetyltransferase (GNAT) domain-containing protein [Gracilibacillus ureilyticus]
MKLQFKNTIPSKTDFHQLFKTTGWDAHRKFSEDKLMNAISNSWYLLSVYHNERLIGFGRVISDGVYQTFICDMMVHPDYQNKGIGSKVFRMLLEKCEESGIKWVQLSCARGKTGFYEKFGFKHRPADGPGMQKFI